MQDLQSYLIQKQRNKVKKELRRASPNLSGQRLDMEVDKVIGVVHSGKVDWTTLVDIVAKKSESKYPTPETITYDEVVAVAREYNVRPYILYWFYKQKLEKLQSTGRARHDYMAVLKGCAVSTVKKSLTDEEKVVAVQLYAKDMKSVIVTRSQAEAKLIMGEI